MTPSPSPTLHAGSTLPVTVSPSTRDKIVLVSGRPGWVDNALSLGESAPGAVILVESPAPEDPSPLADDAHRILLDVPWSHSSSLETFRASLKDMGAAHLEVSLESGIENDFVGRVLAALIVLDRIAGPFTLSWDDYGPCRAAGFGRSDQGNTVSVTATRSAALEDSLRLRALTSQRNVDLRLPVESIARPDELSVEDADGKKLLPTPWETPSRTAWRRAASLVTDTGTTPQTDLASFRRALLLLPSSAPQT